MYEIPPNVPRTLTEGTQKVDDVLRFIIDSSVPFDNNQGLCSGFHNPQDLGNSLVAGLNLQFAT